jgi:hypothetical protein
VCGAVDDIDITFVVSRLGAGFEDGIDRCRRCGATQVDNAEVRARTERAPWPAPAPGPVGADGCPWDGREGLPGGWWRLPCEVGLRVRTLVRAAVGPGDGLMLSTDLYDGFGHPGPVFVDLKALTAWDTGRDDASPTRTVFEALDARFPGRFATVLDLDRPGTVFLALPLLGLTDEVTDAILGHYRRHRPTTGDGGPHPADEPEHDCQAAGTLEYEAEYGAPGFGQALKCTTCGRSWARLGDTFWPAEAGAHILSPHDVE